MRMTEEMLYDRLNTIENGLHLEMPSDLRAQMHKWWEAADGEWCYAHRSVRRWAYTGVAWYALFTVLIFVYPMVTSIPVVLMRAICIAGVGLSCLAVGTWRERRENSFFPNPVDHFMAIRVTPMEDDE